MGDALSVILKVLLLSAALSCAIKYGGPYLALPATTPTALIAILLPATIMAGLLGWRSRQS